MKREIVAEPEIDAFARETMGDKHDNHGSAEPEPFRWIGGTELTQMKPRSKQMVVDKILPAGGLTVIA